jgi:hypothetical protein
MMRGWPKGRKRSQEDIMQRTATRRAKGWYKLQKVVSVTPCIVEGCKEAGMSKGMCKYHYLKQWREERKAKNENR